MNCSPTLPPDKQRTRLEARNAAIYLGWGDPVITGPGGWGKLLLFLVSQTLGGGLQYFLFISRTLGKWSNLTNIFQMGWNHQLEQDVWNFPLSSSKRNALIFERGCFIIEYNKQIGHNRSLSAGIPSNMKFQNHPYRTELGRSWVVFERDHPFCKPFQVWKTVNFHSFKTHSVWLED